LWSVTASFSSSASGALVSSMPLGGQCGRLGVEIGAGQSDQLRVGPRLGEDLVPHAEADHRGIELSHSPIRTRHRQKHVVGHQRSRLARRLDGLRAPALHGRRKCQELVVVRHVHDVIVERLGRGKISEIRRDALAVGFGGILVRFSPAGAVGVPAS
jgi:hypothetical protein